MGTCLKFGKAFSSKIGEVMRLYFGHYGVSLTMRIECGLAFGYYLGRFLIHEVISFILSSKGWLYRVSQ